MNKPFENYECEGQMEIADFCEDVPKRSPDPEPKAYERKPLIYHMSLTRYYFQCPYCRAENSEKHSPEGTFCGCCGKFFEGVVEKKTKDYVECESQLGSGGGAVYKGEDGKWHYSDTLK